jgi:26S proteasome non-ATPase regulatory subunit 10
MGSNKNIINNKNNNKYAQAVVEGNKHAFVDVEDEELDEILRKSAITNKVMEASEYEEDCRSYVHQASANGFHELLELFLTVKEGKRLVNKHEEGDWFGCPLHSSCSGGHLTCAALLLSNGCDVNARTDRGLTALHYAASKGFPDLVKKLIESGADVNAKDALGNTSLHRAASQGRANVIKVLFEEGNAKVDERDSLGQTPLLVACESGQDECAVLLAKLGANVDAKDIEKKGVPDRLKHVLAQIAQDRL